ncbi:hypothetical protein ACFLRM_05025 [Acidobacteriota bacterium]
MSNQIYLINAGVRPIALAMVMNEHLERLLKFARDEKLFYILDPRGETHTSIYMFKHEYLKHVVNASLKRPHDEKTVVHWYAGKMFGYSDVEIKSHVEKEGALF